MADMISVFGCDMGPEEIWAAANVVKSNWLGMGQQVDAFEREMAEYLGVEDFVMVDNCSNALYMGIVLLDLPPRSRIAVPSITWVACAQAVILAGHEPVFVDVDYITMNVTIEDIQRVDADAVMVVHYAGLSVDMEEILEAGIPIIEDAAHAIHATYNDVHCGTIGDVGAFSFDATKNLATCDGGGLVFRNPEKAKEARVLRYCGIGKSGFAAAQANAKGRWWEYDIQDTFIRMIPNDVSAAIARVQLRRRQELQAARKRIWNIYDEGLGALDIDLPVNASGHGRFTYCIKVDNRDELAKYLYDNGVYTTVRYHPLHLNPIYKQGNVDLPISQMLNGCILNLPLHPKMSDEDAWKVVELIRKFEAEHGS